MSNSYTLKNGKNIKVIGVDDWSNLLVELEGCSKTLCIVDGLIHSLTDWGEPIAPIKPQIQLTKSDIERIKNDYPETIADTMT